MVDYHAHAIVLDQLRTALTAASFTDPRLVAARNQTLTDLAVAGDHALLGAMVDHIFAHAAADGAELAALARATDLWQRAVGLYRELGQVRSDVEAALGDPSNPASVSQFNAATFNVQLFAQKAQAMQTEVVALRDDVTSFGHVPAHPRQSDQPVKAWDWGNLFVGRRTDAFVRSLARFAKTPATRAFAFGALASYGANTAGSAYLGSVVGGPRRAHRYRDRVARNTVGAWLARAHPSTPSPGKLADHMHFGGGADPALPASLDQFLQNAVADAFDATKAPPSPNLALGYRRLIKHLRLLDQFGRPPVPNAPSGVWAAILFADPSNPPPSLRPQDIGPSGDPGGGVSLGSNSPGDPSPGKNDDSNTSTTCGIIVAILIIIDVIQAFVQCIVQWAKKQTCTFWDNMLLKKLWEKEPPDPRDPTTPQNVGTDGAGLTAIASSGQVAQLVACLFDIHVQVWEALDRAYHFLSLHGLIYPRHLIDLPVYAQFTSALAVNSWPHRPEADPANRFHVYPSSPLENPTVSSAPFSVGARPDALVTFAVSRVAEPLWRQIANAETDTQNLDMDADRGFLHPCWSAIKSINNDPVDVHVLAYGDL